MSGRSTGASSTTTAFAGQALGEGREDVARGQRLGRRGSAAAGRGGGAAPSRCGTRGGERAYDGAGEASTV